MAGKMANEPITVTFTRLRLQEALDKIFSDSVNYSFATRARQPFTASSRNYKLWQKQPMHTWRPFQRKHGCGRFPRNDKMNLSHFGRTSS
jgi:hypothetical protein